MSLESSLERIADALEKIVAGGNTVTTAVNDVPEVQLGAPEKKKPGRPAKVVEPVAEVDPLGDITDPAPKPAVTQDEVHKALRTFMDKNGIDKTKAFMIKHGANPAKPVLTSIPEKNYPALIAELGA